MRGEGEGTKEREEEKGEGGVNSEMLIMHNYRECYLSIIIDTYIRVRSESQLFHSFQKGR